MLHLANRKCELSELSGIPTLIEKAGLMDVPQARVAVIDGTTHAPGQPWKHERTTIRTLWGELAWILPGSIPLGKSEVRAEMTYLLPQGWDPVIEKDIDGERAETTELEGREPRFGQVNASRRVARTIFLGSAPSCVATKPGIRGLDRARVLLGSLQPGQVAATYTDVLGRLADRLHYLNSSGDKTAEATRFWFDTRSNLRREMEDRKRRFDDKTDIRNRIETVVKALFTFRGSVPINSTLAKSRLNTVADELLAILASDPNAQIRITLEIDADFPQGASDSIKRSVSENANTLGFTTKEWE